MARAAREPRPRADRPETVVLHGIHAVREALRARRRPLHALRVRRGARGAGLEEILAAAARAGIPVEEVDGEELARTAPAGSPVQSVALRAGPLPEASLEELAAAGAAPRTLVALDRVEDPQNLGAVARVAEAAGAGGLVLTRRHAPPLGAAVSRASAGAIEWLPVARVANLARALEALQERGFWIFACDPGAGTDLFALSERALAGDRVVLLGAEGRGLRPGVARRADHLVRIPLAGHVESLNVATAAAVVLFHLARQRS